MYITILFKVICVVYMYICINMNNKYKYTYTIRGTVDREVSE